MASGPNRGSETVWRAVMAVMRGSDGMQLQMLTAMVTLKKPKGTTLKAKYFQNFHRRGFSTSSQLQKDTVTSCPPFKSKQSTNKLYC